MSEITIDTAAYELKTGRKPVGLAFWTFRICSDSDTIGVSFFQPATPMTYDAAVEEAKLIASLHQSTRIVVEPPEDE